VLREPNSASRPFAALTQAAKSQRKTNPKDKGFDSLGGFAWDNGFRVLALAYFASFAAFREI